jgi:hypothetical protein
MISVFFGLGFLILFYNIPGELPQTNRTIIAVLLFGYGAWRAIRIYKNYKYEN